MEKLWKIISWIIHRLSSVLNRIREAAPVAGKAIKEPAILGYVLLTAHRAQIFLTAAVLALLFLVSPLLDSTLKLVYPEKTSNKLFGLVKQKKQNPARKAAHDRILFFLWMITVGETVLLVWLHIPKGYERALSRARIPESSDDGLPEGKSSNVTRIAGSSSQHEPVGPNDRYTLGEELGRGGMGIVYEARDNVLDRQVALKKLPRSLTEDKEYLARFEREAKTLARLTHPSILQIFDLINDRGEFWMALEYIEGGDLAAYLIEHDTFSAIDAADLVQKIADGMAYAHQEKIIHRDLKPGNILLTKNAEPKISDFGLAKMPVSSDLTREGSILGSPRYMSPEQAAGKDVDHRSDIYSLGIMLYEMVTGETPFNGDTSQILAQHLTQAPPPPRQYSPDIPRGLDDLTLKMLIKDPDSRLQSMTEVSDTLTSLATTARSTV